MMAMPCDLRAHDGSRPLICLHSATVHIVIHPGWDFLVCNCHSDVKVDGRDPLLVHNVVPACGMPGSVIDFENNTCLDPFVKMELEVLTETKELAPA